MYTQDMMIIEDGKMNFYSFVLIGENNLDFDIIGDNNLASIYDYYIHLLNSDGFYDKQLLVETYIKSLKFHIEYSLPFENSLNEYYNNEAPEHMIDIIKEGLNNKNILDYFINNDLLKSHSNVKIKK